jgi:hypothetical protein
MRDTVFWFANDTAPTLYLIPSASTNQSRDRTGSNVSGGKRYYPFGEERVLTANNAEKFATYYRDAESGQTISGVTPPSHQIRGGGSWNVTPGSSSFADHYSNGLNAGPTNASQSYFLAGQLPLEPLIVLEPNGSGNAAEYPRYSVQGVYYTNQAVIINTLSRNPFVPGREGCQAPFISLGSPVRWHI